MASNQTVTGEETSGPFKVTHYAKKAGLECTTCRQPIPVGAKFYRYTVQGARMYGDRLPRRECESCLKQRNERCLSSQGAEA